MYKGKSFLAIIPARGGSKRLPRKNVLELAGKPLICWTIEAAKSSKYVDKVVVTSDDNEILSISANQFVEIIRRPDYLASDTATTFDVIKHAILNIRGSYDFIILLQPTSPLRTALQIDESIELLMEKEASAVISVCKDGHSPLWSNTLPDDGNMGSFIREEIKNKRSQELPEYYRLNGSIYICRTQKLIEEGTFFIRKNIFAYKMGQESSIDIDEKIDYEFAEFYLYKYQTINLSSKYKK